MKIIKLSLLVFSILIMSCDDSKNQKYLPSSIGAINQVTVVMDNELWKSAVGDKVRDHFAANAVGLTWQESIFTLNHVPPKVFTGALRGTRAVVYVEKDSIDKTFIKKDVYATPQNVAIVKGTTEEVLIKNIESIAEKAISTFKQIELEETQKRLLKSLNKEGVLEKKFNITMSVPSIYKVGVEKDNFVWMDREIQKGNMNIIAYEMPANSYTSDSTLVSDIVRMRDSIGKLYVPGPDVPNKTTYMRTEPAFSPSVFPIEIQGIKGVEVRGVWDIKNYPMAGPFLTYILNDKVNNRKMVIEGFTFAPATNKRDDMFRLEAILKTIKFK